MAQWEDSSGAAKPEIQLMVSEEELGVENSDIWPEPMVQLAFGEGTPLDPSIPTRSARDIATSFPDGHKAPLLVTELDEKTGLQFGVNTSLATDSAWKSQ